MNLFFRLIKVIVLLWLRPGRLKPLETSVLRLRAWPGDLDTNGHVNNGRYLTYMDLGRFDLLIRGGLWRAGVRNRWMPVLAAAMIRFRRSLRAFEKVTLRTRLVGWDESWIYLEQLLLNREGVVATAYLRGVFLRKNKRVPVSELLAAMNHREPSPPFPEGLKAWLAADEAMDREAKRGLQAAGGSSGASGGG